MNEKILQNRNEVKNQKKLTMKENKKMELKEPKKNGEVRLPVPCDQSAF